MSRLIQRHILVVLMVALAAITVAAGAGQNAREVFERARLLEAANPQSPELVKLYEQAATLAKTDRPLAAQALLGLARAQERAGKPEARATYERIVKEYLDQVETATAARMALETLPAVPGAPSTSRLVGRYLRGEAITASAVAPDGKSAVLAVQTGGGPATTYALVRRNLQTGADRNLTRLRNAAQSVRFAPGGRHVAAVILSSTAEALQEELVVVDLDASASAPIVFPGITLPRADAAKFEATDNPWMVRLAWSPDGESLAYVVLGSTPRSFDCRLLNVATGETRSLGISVEAKPDFRWSSQGVLAIHVTESGTGTDVIRLITPASNQTRTVQLPKGPDFSTWLGQWTESGSIAIVQDRPAAAPEKGRASVFLLNIETGQLTATCAGNGPYRMEGKPVFWINRGGGPDQCLQITRDGKSQIIWKSASKKLIVRDVQTGVDRNLTIGSGEEDYGILTPDHRAIVFVSDRDGQWGLYSAPLSTVPSDSPALLTELDELPRSLDLQWTTDGMVAAWTVLRRNIWRLEVDREKGRATGSAERLTQESPQNFIPAISPNGRQIAYYSIRGARNGLAVMNADGSGERFVREFQFVSPTFPPKPAWRTNDEVIVAAPLLGDLSGPIEISTVDIRSGMVTKRIPRLVTNGFDGEYLVKTDEVVYAWKEDSAGAGVQAAGWTELRATSLANGDTRTLVRFGAADGRITSFRLSPDGQRVAYLLVKDPGNRNSGEFGVLSLQDGSRRVLASNRSVTAGAGIVAWSPDGRFIHYNQGVPRVFDTAAAVGQGAPAAGQASWPLAAPGQAVDWMAAAGSWSPDGSFILVTQSDGGEELRQWHGLAIAALTQRSPTRR